MRRLLLLCLLALPAVGQVVNIRISMSPGDGLSFLVDGAQFQGAANFLWPEGSKHTLTVQAVEYGNTPGAQYAFQGMVINTLVVGQQLLASAWPLSTLVVTADPNIQSVVVNFNTAYKFDVVFFSCPTDGPCLSPAQIYGLSAGCQPGVSGFIVESTFCYVAAGTTLTLTAQPNTGYIFTGWSATSGTGNVNQSFVNSYTVNKPLEVYPQFMLSRLVNVGVSTSPAGLQVLADHTALPSPATLDWGTGTVHGVSVESPQTDSTGGVWVFSSWSDGGAQNHNYTVPDGFTPLSLTALFQPAHRVTFGTNPVGLSLSINGRSNWTSLTFIGAAGTQYQVSAPATQTDAQGRINQFVSWSNGGSATQTYTQPGSDDHVTATYQTLGHLTLISSPPGLSFTVNGAACVSPCGFDQAPGTQMNISVPPSIPLSANSRLDFQGWQDSAANSRVYTMTGALQVLSVSYQTMFLVASVSSPATGGSVVVQPASPDGFYAANTQLQATVSQNPGFQFRSWQGDIAGAQPTVTLSVSSPKAFGAVFGPVPYLPPDAVQNAAGVTPVNGVAPGAIVSLYGLNLAGSALLGPMNPLSQALLNVTATIGAQILPLFAVSPQQINVQLPFETPLGQQVLVVHQLGQPDVSAVFSAVRNAPGLFGLEHADGSTVTAASPAAPGEILTVTGTGFGPYDRNAPDGIVIPGNSTFVLLDAVSVTAGGLPATVLSYGPSYAGVGLNLATFQVPASLPSGTSVPLNVTVNGAESNQISLFLQ